jgi:hypothetical protein
MLDGFVDPLLDFWRIIIARADGILTVDDLGRMFIDLHGDREQAERRANALRRTAEVWLRPDPTDPDVPTELLDLLRRRAWPSAHIQWALIEPVRMYQRLLDAHLAGADGVTLGSMLERLVEEWAPELPISDVWSTLCTEQLVAELRFCDDTLLQSPASRRCFRERLAKRFPDVTSVGATIGDRHYGTEGGGR